MEKLLKLIRVLISLIVNVVMLGGLAIVLLWLIWDISPQTSITKTAYFFSQSAAIITGQRPSEEKPAPVRSEQLEKSADYTTYVGFGKRK